MAKYTDKRCFYGLRNITVKRYEHCRIVYQPVLIAVEVRQHGKGACV